MYSPELMKFLLEYHKEEQASSKKTYNFKNGSRVWGSEKLAVVPVYIRKK